MKVLVTGAGGFIGSKVVKHLFERGAQVTAVVRSAATADRLRELRGKIAIAEADLGDGAAVTRLFEDVRPEALMHLAWYAGPSDYLVSNRNLDSLDISNRVIRTAVQAGVKKVVGAGTCLEYANSSRPRSETDPSGPHTLYATCKLAALSVATVLTRDSDTEFAWGRIFHVHGPGEDPARLIPAVAAQLRRGQGVDVTPGEQVRDHLHVDDVATGLSCLLQPGARGVVNISSGTPVTLRAVLSTVGRLLERESLLKFGARPYRQDEVMFLAGDSTKLRGLGWVPRFSLESGLADAIRFQPEE